MTWLWILVGVVLCVLAFVIGLSIAVILSLPVEGAVQKGWGRRWWRRRFS